MDRVKLLLLAISSAGFVFSSWSVCSQEVVHIDGSLEISSEDWEDYLIQDVCLGVVDDDNPTAIPSPMYGDPNTCSPRRNLQVGENIFSGFRYSQGELSLAYSFPRINRDGKTVVMNLVSDASGISAPDPTSSTPPKIRGTYEFDDPHCAVLIGEKSPCGAGSEKESDIFDITEFDLDSSWFNVASIAATAHASYTKQLSTLGSSEVGFYTSHFNPGSPPDFPDGWVLGIAGSKLLERNPGAAWNVFRDSDINSVSSYPQWASWNKETCDSKLEGTLSICDAISYHQWLIVDEVFMGEGKTFNSVVIASHGSDISPLPIGCDLQPIPGGGQAAVACRLEEECRPGHQEVFYFSKEYGFMRHEVWKNSLCEPAVNEADAIQCPDGTGLQSPRFYSQLGEVHELRRTSCAQWVSNGADYQFDPDSIPAVSKSQAYPNVEVFDKLGKGNLLMNPQFAWTDKSMGGWKSEYANGDEGPDKNSFNEKTIVVTEISDAAKLNRSAKIITSKTNTTWVYQDVLLGIRSPSTKGQSVRFGVRINAENADAVSGNISVCLFQRDDAELPTTSPSCRAINVNINIPIWKDSDAIFVEGEDFVDAQTETLRFQIYFPSNGQTYYIDDAFIVEN